MNYYVITGTSTGLGEALVETLMTKNNQIYCISRNSNKELIEKAKERNCTIYFINYDLMNVEGIKDLIEGIVREIKVTDAEQIILINNAGIVNPIKPIGECLSSDIIRNVTVNEIAPMVLTNEFIKYTEQFTCARKVVNISSGAAKKPYYGWASYCSSKAGLNLFTECVGVEQQIRTNPVKIYAFDPGIIDTPMQTTIRASKEADFKQVERFKQFKEQGQLKQPDFVAHKVIELIEKNDIDTGCIISIKEML